MINDIIFPGLEPPRGLLVHSHWTVDDTKMSKSKYNVIDPNVVSQTYTYEGLRYFLLREGVAHKDGSEYLLTFQSSGSIRSHSLLSLFLRLQRCQSDTNFELGIGGHLGQPAVARMR